jgi:hypothetical protein
LIITYFTVDFTAICAKAVAIALETSFTFIECVHGNVLCWLDLIWDERKKVFGKFVFVDFGFVFIDV